MMSNPPPLSEPQKQALRQIGALYAEHRLRMSDVQSACHEATLQQPDMDSKSARGAFLTMLFGLLGGALIVSGFFIYAAMIWDDLGGFGRVVLSLGSGILCFGIAGILQAKAETQKAAPFLWVLAFGLIPTGLFVFLKEYINGGDPIMGGVIVFGLCSAMFFALYKKHGTKTLFSCSLFFTLAFIGTAYEKAGVNIPGMWFFTGISILFLGLRLYQAGKGWQADRMLSIGTIATTGSLYYFIGNTHYEVLMSAAFIALILAAYHMQCRHFIVSATIGFVILVSKHFGFSAGYREDDILRLSAAVTGASMMLTGHWISAHTLSRRMPALWCFFGSILFFSAAMGILYDTAFDALFVFLPAALLYISLNIRSRALMFSSILAILSFISYYSARYFADTVGWPITLMIVGFVMIAGCALAMRLNTRLKAQG